jgi:hypothetical protein
LVISTLALSMLIDWSGAHFSTDSPRAATSQE